MSTHKHCYVVRAGGHLVHWVSSINPHGGYGYSTSRNPVRVNGRLCDGALAMTEQQVAVYRAYCDCIGQTCHEIPVTKATEGGA